MKPSIILFFAVFALVLVSLGCAGLALGRTRGSGRIVEESRPVSGFSRLDMAALGDVIIEVGEEESLRIEADDNLLPYLETEVRGQTLQIRCRPATASLWPSQTIHFYLTVKSLEGIALSGAGRIEAADLLQAERFTLDLSGTGNMDLRELEVQTLGVNLSGAGDLLIQQVQAENQETDISGTGSVTIRDLDADRLRLNISGAGDMSVEAGRVEKQTIHVGGAGSYKAKTLESDEAEVTLDGVGSATVRVEERLDVEISGAGSVQYVGDPLVQQTIGGVGRVERLNE